MIYAEADYYASSCGNDVEPKQAFLVGAMLAKRYLFGTIEDLEFKIKDLTGEIVSIRDLASEKQV